MTTVSSNIGIFILRSVFVLSGFHLQIKFKIDRRSKKYFAMDLNQ